MKAVFAHDHVFDRDSDGKYYSEKLPYTLWQQRYLTVFDSIKIVARSRPWDPVDIAEKALAVGPGVDVYPVPTVSSPWAAFRNSADVRHVLYERIAESDCVIARLPSEIGLTSVAVARNMGKPVVIELVGCPWDALWNYGSWQGKVYAPLAYRRNRSAVAKASHVVYVTDRFLQKRYPTNGCTAAISNAVICPPLPDVLKNRLVKDTSPLRIGLVGNLLPYKGIATLLKAGSYLQQRKAPGFRICFLGAGPTSMWEKLAARLNVSTLCDFCGVLPPGPRIWEWLDDIDIYVQPSFVEGLPRATIEAMSRACPVVASTVGGLPELAPRENLHKPRDAHHLADLLERMLVDETWRRNCSRHSFAKSHDYAPENLEQRRREFWTNFIEHSESLHKPRK